MTTILLNFMIGVIIEVYDKVIQREKLHIYNERANLNRDFFQIKKYIPWLNLQEKRVLVFSSVKDDDLNDQEENTNRVEKWVQETRPKIEKEIKF